MTCECANGYVGRHCEIHLLDTVDGECGIENCIIQCPYDEEEEQQPCACKNGTKIYNNRSRYECRIKLSNVTSLRSGLIAQHGSLESYVGKQADVGSHFPLFWKLRGRRQNSRVFEQVGSTSTAQRNLPRVDSLHLPAKARAQIAESPAESRKRARDSSR